MINRTIAEHHSLRTGLFIFAFLVLAAFSYRMEQRMETAQQTVEIDYN